MEKLKIRIKRIINAKSRQAYMQWYFKQEVSEKIHWQGVSLLKLVTDLWNYQEIIFENKIRNVVEFGSWRGGSALFFADFLRLNQTGGKVLTVDISPEWDASTERPDIIRLKSSSISMECGAAISMIREELPGRILFILDSEHTILHVTAEIEFLMNCILPGDYIVIEDTISIPGMIQTISHIMKKYPFMIHDHTREGKFGITLARNGYWFAKGRAEPK